MCQAGSAQSAAQPLDALAHHLRGQIYEHAGDLDAALAAYRRSLYLDPGLVLGALGMAHIWRQTGHLAEAQRALRGALYQLERSDPAAPVAGAGEATVAELRAYVRDQIVALGAAGH